MWELEFKILAPSPPACKIQSDVFNMGGRDSLGENKEGLFDINNYLSLLNINIKVLSEIKQ